MYKYQNCFLCEKSDNLEVLFTAKDIYRKTSDEEFLYCNCKNCNHFFLRKIPSDLGKYYNDKYYDLPALSNFKKTALKEKFKYDIVKNYFSDGDKICEIGPSIGIFLYNALSSNLDCTAIEMSKECCEFMKKNFRIKVFHTNEPEKQIVKMEKQKAFFFWHSLEHIKNPKEVLDSCIDNLEKDGLLIISCPNPESLGARLTRKYWPHLDAPRHLNLFSIHTLNNYMRQKKLAQIYLTTNDISSKYYNSFSWQLFFFNFFNQKKPFDFDKKNINYFFWKLIGKLISYLLYPIENTGNRGSCYTLIFKKN